MKKRALVVSISTALLISGCASMGKDGRIGQNDGSDPCFVTLNSLDEMAIYYKDERMKSIATGVLIGGATGVLAGMAAGKSDVAMIAGGVTGAVAGGFAADAYWKNKLQQANNQMDQAIGLIEADMKQDTDRLLHMDSDLAALIRCRTNQMNIIRNQYAEGKITEQQARDEWKKLGDLARKDQDEMIYLDEALVNIRKVNESYSFAATAAESPAFITKDIQKQWHQQRQDNTKKKLADLEIESKKELTVKGITKSERKIVTAKKMQKVVEIKKQDKIEKAMIDDKKNPHPETVGLGKSSSGLAKVELDLSQKKTDLKVVNNDMTTVDAFKKKSTMEKTTSKLNPTYNYAGFFAYCVF